MSNVSLEALDKAIAQLQSGLEYYDSQIVADNPPLAERIYDELLCDLRDSDLAIRIDVAEWSRLPDWLREDIKREYEVIQPAKVSSNRQNLI